MLQEMSETPYALFLGCLTKMLRFDWASVSSISRKTVEQTGHNGFIFTSRGIAANTKENHKNVSTCNQKFELVIPQLTILLNRLHSVQQPGCGMNDRRMQVRLHLVARNFSLCQYIQPGPRAQPVSYLMGHYAFARSLRRTEHAADSLLPRNVVV